MDLEEKRKRLQVLQLSRPTAVKMTVVSPPQSTAKINVSGAAPTNTPRYVAPKQQNLAQKLVNNLWQGFQEAPRAAGTGISLAGKQGEETRASQLRLQEQTTSSILKADRKYRDTSLPYEERVRWANYLNKVAPEAQQREVDVRKELEQNVKNLSPKKQLAAYASMGFDVATAGVGAGTGQAIKEAGAVTAKQIAKVVAKQAAKGALFAAPSGGFGAVVTKGDEASLKDIATGAVLAGTVGAALPIVGYGFSKMAKSVISKIADSGSADDIARVLEKEASGLSEEEAQNLGKVLANESDPEVVKTILKSVDESAPTSNAGVVADIATAAKSVDKPTIAKFVRESFPGVTKREEIALVNKIARTTNPEEVTNIINEQIQRKQQVTQALDQATPEAAPQTPTQALEQAAQETPPNANISQATPTTATPDGTPNASADIAQGKVSPEVGAKVEEASIQIPGTIQGETKLSEFRAQAASVLIDDDARVLKLLREADKADGGNRVERWMFYTDNVRNSNAMANNYIKNNANIKQAFDGLDDVGFDEFDKYAAARSELANVQSGLKRTSRDIAELTNTFNQLDATYGEKFNALNRYYKDLALEMYNGGIIDDAKLTSWLQNDDYVRIQRDMEDLANQKFGRSGSRSFRSTSAKQKRTGSAREILSPSSSSAKRTQEIFTEIQRNKAATEATNLFQELGVANKVSNSTTNKNTVYRFVNGAQETFEVPVEIKQIMDNINPINLGVLKQVISVPSRALRAGTTSLSAPFAAVNYMRDQLSSFLVSDNVIATHNPSNVIRGLKNAIQDFYGGNTSELWSKFEKYAGDQTIYDELRNAKNTDKLMKEIAGGNKAKFRNAITSPVRTLEDLIGITEKSTRFQNFRGVYNAAKKQNLSEEDAIIRAVVKARENSVNFSRGTNFTRAANLLLPYFNASVQGTRTVARAFRDRPVATGAKLLTTVTVPSVALAAYNMSSEEGKRAWADISQFEKDNNFIMFTPNLKQQDDGTWTGIVKVPKPQGFKEISNPVEQLAYKFFYDEPTESALSMFQHVVGGFTGPININTADQALGSIIPQAVKPLIQAQTNKDFYTGAEIVPDWVSADIEDPTQQAYKGTSGAARYIANALGVSPIKVEKAIYDTFGSLGRYGVNAVDNALAATGKIPDEQIGGRSAATDFSRRLFEARGTEIQNKTDTQQYFANVKDALKQVNLNSTEQKAFDSTVLPKKKTSTGEQLVDKTYYDSASKAITYLRYPKTFEVSRAIDAKAREQGKPGDPLYDLPPDQLKTVLNLQANYSPGNKEEKAIAKLNPWLKDFNQKRSEYFEKVLPEGKATDAMGLKVPKATPDVQAKINQSSQLTDSAAKAQFYRDNPEVSDYFAEQNNYQRAKRSFLGLPQFDNYPTPSKEVQSIIDEYNKLPQGNGPIGKTTGKPTSPARSAWIKANPDKFAQMNEQWSRQDIYRLQEEGSLAVYEGLDFTEQGIKSIQDLAKALGVSTGSYGSNGYGYGKSGGSAAKDYMSIMKLLSGLDTKLPTAPTINQKISTPKLRFKQPFSGAKAKLRVQLKT